MKQETVQGKRIGKVVGIAMENERMIKEYESLTSDLLAWIQATITALGESIKQNKLMIILILALFCLKSWKLCIFFIILLFSSVSCFAKFQCIVSTQFWLFCDNYLVTLASIL